jgi:hypothetical protein
MMNLKANACSTEQRIENGNTGLLVIADYRILGHLVALFLQLQLIPEFSCESK